MALPPVTSGLVCALQADTLALADGATVTSWPDSSAAGNNPSFSGSMRYATNGTPLGTAVVRSGLVGGVNQFTLPSGLLSASTAAEMFWVLRSTKWDLSASDDNPGVYIFGGGDRTYWPATGGIFDGAFTGTRYTLSTDPTLARSWHVFNVSHDGVHYTANYDNQRLLRALVGYTQPTSFTVGHNFADWAGDYAEILVYNRALTATERTSVLNYLYTKHISATAPATFVPPLSDSYIAYAASADNAANGQGVAQAFDGLTSTKWLAFASTGWIQVQVATPVTIYTYQLTSAEDVAGRDPQNWLLQGSTDGSTFTTVDSRTGQTFASRLLTRTFAVTSPAAYSFYRLTITANSGDVSTQLAELTLSDTAPQQVDAPVIDASSTPLTGTPAVHYHVDAPVIGVLVYVASAPQQVDLLVLDVTADVAKPANANPAPVLDVTADLAAPIDSTPIRVAVPVLAAKTGLYAPGFQRVQRIAVQPGAGAAVPVLQPLFEVDFTQLEGTLDTADVVIEYAPNATFTGATVLTVPAVDVAQGVNAVRAQAAAPLTPGVWWWHVRVGADGSWTAAHIFTVADGGGDDTVTVTAQVSAGDTAPVIWSVAPTTGVVGEVVTIHGQGFSDVAGQVLLNDTPMDIQAWETRIETDPGVGVRVIDLAAGRIDCEHDTITALVPADAGVGDYSLIVTDPQ